MFRDNYFSAYFNFTSRRGDYNLFVPEANTAE